MRRAFTIVFALGGALAALAGVLSGGLDSRVVDPGRGTSLLIFAFIVVVIGAGLRLDRWLRGRGRRGASGLSQQYDDYHAVERNRRPRSRLPSSLVLDSCPAASRVACCEGLTGRCVELLVA